MSDHHRERLPHELRDIAELLEDERPEATPLELDRMKLRAQSRASAARRRPALIGKGNGFMRSRVVSLLLLTGLLGGGTGAMAAAGGPLPFDVLSSENEHASNSQYCPPTSWHPGKPKKPGPARCGKGPRDDDDGDDAPGDDDDHGNGNAFGRGQGNHGRWSGNWNGQGTGNAYGRGNGHGRGNSAVQSQGNGPGDGKGHGNSNAGGRGNGGGKHK
jgi:hypothetical protein